MPISILLPTFNTAPYLAECLDSILAQTEQDWELIAVNNFSTDTSPEILQAYAARDHRIRFFHNDDILGKTGVSPAMRFAFRQATGQFITRMDSDDIMPPDRLFLMKKLLLQHGLGHVATGAVQFFGEDGVGEGFRKYEAWLNRLAASGGHFEVIYRENVLPSPVWMAWREDLERAAAFAEDIYPEDYDLTFRLRHAGCQIVATTELLHHWRERPDRTSRTDPKYLDNNYLDLKTQWFLRTDYDDSRPLVLWGAGRKGKRLAALLRTCDVPFRWVCDQPSKWGHVVSGVAMEDFEILSELPDCQVIVAVAAVDGQAFILDFFEKNRMKAGRDFWFFC
ncbi:MAG: glycosyltransferase [Saprospiraceae bacterium]|nr:glycosyltransferase [Saprospiraceae bacterium]MCF8251525.1 glycosyltransferase [Saprospiraceae bacterium]MCF8280855.1 glycosyltransferase [Bacteroidales bacterium]MCF8310965.1 glycosyltransferase [Saprospiraceae bacterium]MCF8439699.1 glycosyltransferase [Saprospiraceae bacterium]